MRHKRIAFCSHVHCRTTVIPTRGKCPVCGKEIRYLTEQEIERFNGSLPPPAVRPPLWRLRLKKLTHKVIDATFRLHILRKNSADSNR